MSGVSRPAGLIASRLVAQCLDLLFATGVAAPRILVAQGLKVAWVEEQGLVASMRDLVVSDDGTSLAAGLQAELAERLLGELSFSTDLPGLEVIEAPVASSRSRSTVVTP